MGTFLVVLSFKKKKKTSLLPMLGAQFQSLMEKLKIPHALQHSQINNKRLFENQMSAGRRRVPWTVKAGLKRSRGLSPGALCASRERGWHPLLPSSALSRQLNSFSSADGTSAAHNWL